MTDLATTAAMTAAEALDWVTGEYGSFGENDDWGFVGIRKLPDGGAHVEAEHYDDDGEVESRYILTIHAQRLPK